jgi:hypothetical protein
MQALETMERDVDSGEGHDDGLMSSARLSEALASFVAPKEAGEVRPRAMDEGESRYEAGTRLSLFTLGEGLLPAHGSGPPPHMV